MQSVSAPFFSPRSVFWRVNREIACGLAAPRAVLMQIAHPLVAAGVAEHSEFRKHRFARLYRTAFAATALTFGGRESALAAVEMINRRHAKVHGTLRTAAGIFPAGTRYDANDPYLKLWVLSTITDSALLAYDLLVAPLSLEERCSYYDDSLIAAELFGIPPGITPKTYADFCAYMNRMFSSETIQVSDQARDIAKALFAPTPSGLLLLGGSALGICLLPEKLRRDLDLDWRLLSKLGRVPSFCRAMRRVTPAILCANPAATVTDLQMRFQQWRDSSNGSVGYHERP
jgi:uncharacterized protein (DUF2236 family)